MSKNVILAPYLTSKLDPQRHKQWPIDDYSKIKIWKESIEVLKLNGVIFHDQLSQEFINKHQSHYIKFIRCNNDYSWSTNDFRFAVYNHYLKQNNDIEFVFVTDITDVKVVHDPFEQIKKQKLENKIITGLDNAGIINKSVWHRMKNYGYIPKYTTFWQTLPYPVLNAGILGGSRTNIIKFTDKMIEEFLQINNPNENNNMAVFNYVCYKYFKNEIITGEPICSKFTRFESTRRDVWFIHK